VAPSSLHYRADQSLSLPQSYALALILLIVALLKQLIVLVGFMLALVKFAIVVAFVAVMVMIVVAIWRSRAREKQELNET
jgi:hypothetical protein